MLEGRIGDAGRPARAAPPRRIAIVGCGGIAHEHLDALRRVPGADVVAVCDTSLATARFVAERYGVERVATSLDDLLEGGPSGTSQPDVVHVLTPPHTHESIVRQCLSAGRHVVCEKPLAPTASIAESLFALARDQDVMLFESHNMRFNDQVDELDRIIASGRLGIVHDVEVSLQLDLTDGPLGDVNLTGPGIDLPGGAVHDMLPHLAYLVLHLHGLLTVPHAGVRHPARHRSAGDVEVLGWTANRSSNPKVGLDGLDALVRLHGGHDDAGSAIDLRRARIVVASDVGPDIFRVTVRGSAATAHADLYQPFVRVEGEPWVGARAPIGQVIGGYGSVVAGVSNFLDKVRRHGPMHGLTTMLRHVDAEVAAAVATGRITTGTEADSVLTARLVDRLVSLPCEAGSPA